MSKVILAYSVAGLSLFGALFAALALSGLLRPAPTAQEAAIAQAAAVPPPPPPTQYVPPTLEPGRVYRMSHETPIYPAPLQSEADRILLPAGGFFRAIGGLDEPPGAWMEISVYDGAREFTMYLYTMDLRWKTLTPQYSAEETAQAEQLAVLQRVRDSGGLRRNRATVLQPEPEIKTLTFDQWWAETAQRMGGADSANLIVSASAAAIATLLILGSIAALAMLRREHTWSSPAVYDETETLHGDDDPFAYAHTDPDEMGEADGEDRPRE